MLSSLWLSISCMGSCSISERNKLYAKELELGGLV
jgi:hypothetical protein